VGSSEAKSVDVRFIAATNRDLRTEVNRGAFRSDLYFRLSVVTVWMPPLRDRKEDIPALAKSFLTQLSPKGSGPLSHEVMERFVLHDWPGNVRELRNYVERVATMGEHWVRPSSERAVLGSEVPAESFKSAKQRVIDRFERDYLAELLKRHGGNASAAAREAQLNRIHLLKLLRRHGLRE
jgi:DNA-binding NtrC family response regulator